MSWGVLGCGLLGGCGLLIGCGLLGGCNGAESEFNAGAVDPLQSRRYRAIAGVSMGGYGAMNLGTKHDDRFGVVGSLGGPVDLSVLLRDLEREGLGVRAVNSTAPRTGSTFDRMPSFPSRDDRLVMIKDLVLAFGNPFLHHTDPARLYFASDSQPAQLQVDDQFGALILPFSAAGFLDGGDLNGDGLRDSSERAVVSTDVLLLDRGSVFQIAGLAASTFVGERGVLDLDGDSIYDVGDGIVINSSEPFTDFNDNGVLDPSLGESFSDVGLDGVADSGDFGEGNGVFDWDPDRANWLAEDPVTRLSQRSSERILAQRFYMDVGAADEFGFEQHYFRLVSVLESKGVNVTIQDGFGSGCLEVPHFPSSTPSNAHWVRYDGGHGGFGNSGELSRDLSDGDICGELLVWQRVLHLIAAMDGAFPEGFYGAGGFSLGDTFPVDIPSPQLDSGLRSDASGFDPISFDPISFDPISFDPIARRCLIYRPPAFHNTSASFPIVYFLGGHGQHPSDFQRVGELLDFLTFTGEIQNMYWVFVPGAGGEQGSFYVNHVIPSAQSPSAMLTSGRYEDSLLLDIMPEVENHWLQGRVRSD